MPTKYLKFGGKLGLLKDAWGDFPINQEFADAVSGGNTKGGQKLLDQASLFRMIKNNGEPQQLDLEDVYRNMEALFSDRLREAGIDEGRLAAAFRGSDQDFFGFVTAAKRMPIPLSVRNLDERKVNVRCKKFIGRFVLYRLGVTPRHAQPSKRPKGGQGPRSTAPRTIVNVLRRVPIRIEAENGVGYLRIFGEYEGNKTTGYLFFIDQYVTIWGEDEENMGFSELFLAHLRPELIQGQMYAGVIAMRGDLDEPTAYKFFLRRTEDSEQDIPWHDYVAKYERTIALTDIDADGVFELSRREREVNESGTGWSYAKYANLLQISPNIIDLQY